MTVDGSGDDDRITLEGLDKPYTFFMDAEDSSDNEGASETANDGSEVDDDQGVGGGEKGLRGGGQGDNSGEDMGDGDSSDENDDGKFDFHQSLIFPGVVVVFLLIIRIIFLIFLLLLHLRITRIGEYMFSYGGGTSWRDLLGLSVQISPTTRTTN